MVKRHMHVRQVEYGKESGEDVTRDLLEILFSYREVTCPTSPPAAEVERAQP
jgi:hypothetical protein